MSGYRYYMKATCPHCKDKRTVRKDNRTHPCKGCSVMLRSVPSGLNKLFTKHLESANNLGLPIRQVIRFLLVHLSQLRLKGEVLSALDYPVIPSHCPDLGLKLRIGIGRLTGRSKTAHGNSFSIHNYNVLSLDHINSSKPIVGNMRWVSFRANKLKSNASLKEIKLLAKAWGNLQEK